MSYLKALLDAHDRGELTRTEVASNICKAIHIPELLQQEEFESIIELACDLELPDNYRMDAREKDKCWMQLVEEISG